METADYEAEINEAIGTRPPHLQKDGEDNGSKSSLVINRDGCVRVPSVIGSVSFTIPMLSSTIDANRQTKPAKGAS